MDCSGFKAKFQMPRPNSELAFAVSAPPYYTVDKITGNKVEIDVVHQSGQAFLRTRADGKFNDNILALPECPATTKLIAWRGVGKCPGCLEFGVIPGERSEGGDPEWQPKDLFRWIPFHRFARRG